MNKKDNWAIVTPVDLEVEREKKGYELLTENVIKCGDCRASLLDIIKVLENDSIIKEIKATCPRCGGESFIYRMAGSSYLQAVSGLAINNMPTNIDKEGIIHMTVELIKNE